MQWQKVMNIEEAQKKHQHIIRIGSKKLCLWFQNDTWFAFDLRCPHEGYPLSQGDVDGKCVLTCRWHNWRFRLTDGKALRGQDRLQTYPVKIEDGILWVDTQLPSREVRRKHLLEDMKPLFQRRYYGAMGRLWAKWQAQGFSAADLHSQALVWSVDHLERGFTHSITAIGEWMTFSKRFEDPAKQLSCHLEAMDFLAEDTFGEPHFPYAEGRESFERKKFIQALEGEDEKTAVRMVQHHLDGELGFEKLESALVQFVFSHYLGYGHGAIYLSKLSHLLRTLDHPAKRPLMISFVRYMCTAIRDDILPDFKNYDAIYKQVHEQLHHASQNREHPNLPALGATLSEVWAWLIQVTQAHHPQAIFEALAHAAARNLLHFRESIQHRTDLKPKDTFSWLSISHGVTFAEASLKLLPRYPQIMPAVLVQLAAFIGRVHLAIDPQLETSSWQVTDLDGLNTWAQERILNAGETQNIYPVHWLKTFLATESLATQLPDHIHPTLWAALNRYLQAPVFKKSPVRTIRQAQSLLVPEATLST